LLHSLGGDSRPRLSGRAKPRQLADGHCNSGDALTADQPFLPFRDYPAPHDTLPVRTKKQDPLVGWVLSSVATNKLLVIF